MARPIRNGGRRCIRLRCSIRKRRFAPAFSNKSAANGWSGFSESYGFNFLSATGPSPPFTVYQSIKKYAELRSDGESTMTERMIMLTHHKKKLEGEIDILNEHLEKLKEKIIYYEGEIKNKV